MTQPATTTKPLTIAVGMSGGVDSSVTAWLFKQKGHHVVGVTMGALDHLDDVALTIHSLRRASQNPELAVIVGGAPFNREPDLVARVGADGTAPDGPTAVVLAKRLLLRQIADAPWAPT